MNNFAIIQDTVLDLNGEVISVYYMISDGVTIDVYRPFNTYAEARQYIFENYKL